MVLGTTRLPANLVGQAHYYNWLDWNEVLTIQSVLIEWKLEVRNEDDD